MKPLLEEVKMEGRIARIESDVSHIQKDVTDLTIDVRSLRDRLDAGFDRVGRNFTEVRQSIAQLSVAMEKAYGKARVATIETRVWGLVTLGGVVVIIAKAFRWI